MALEASVKLMFDFSDFSYSLDKDGVIPSLAWRYTLEELLTEQVGVKLVSTAPYCPSLEASYRLVRGFFESSASLSMLLDLPTLYKLKNNDLAIHLCTDVLIIEVVAVIKAEMGIIQ